MKTQTVIQRVVDGTTTMDEAKQLLMYSREELCELAVRQLRELSRLRHLPNYDLLDMVERYLDGTANRQIRVLAREKEEQVARQNFDAAAEIREQQKELEDFWSKKAMLQRVRYALGKDV